MTPQGVHRNFLVALGQRSMSPEVKRSNTVITAFMKHRVVLYPSFAILFFRRIINPNILSF